ncbi:GNAT family N-acetyltransferase [Kibdelosporangium philippinense]|uniref:GNAT family N-acetyltransferase n=1 Tax=Kibdelosporangium philippinense TaxID=211113 RepID=A0ABS8ZR87_9PSEU|nr:GNAT family N-acetyltransferase [Kibdelosporangium philippinense]MCE7010236.1 GNAT family N-acetyltransferase [Kibdelosporangium philippinense]
MDLDPQLANCRDYWLGWGIADRSADSLVYYRSGLANPMLNGVLRLSDDNVDDAIAQLAGVPWVWWVGPDSAPETARRLTDRGAAKILTWPIMTIRLDRVAEVECPPRVKIETVDDNVGEFVSTWAPSLGVAPELVDDCVRVETEWQNTVRVVARIDGQAVGTAQMLDAHDVAGIYVVTTAEPHRCQGIGTALTVAALRAGQERGLRIGTLQSTPLGTPVYARMGFETVGEYNLFHVPS